MLNRCHNLTCPKAILWKHHKHRFWIVFFHSIEDSFIDPLSLTRNHDVTFYFFSSFHITHPNHQESFPMYPQRISKIQLFLIGFTRFFQSIISSSLDYYNSMYYISVCSCLLLSLEGFEYTDECMNVNSLNGFFNTTMGLFIVLNKCCFTLYAYNNELYIACVQ